MAMQDTTKIKEDILTFLKNNGPSLPVQISRYIKVDTLFTSAFLSELLSNQKLKISSMKVGSSPIYYINGTEEGLEKYSEYLKSKEKEAYELLKEKKFLEDETEHPAIRVALRQIKDFAKAFEENNKIIWRYYLIPREEYKKNIEKEPEKKEETIEIKQEVHKEQKINEAIKETKELAQEEKPTTQEKPEKKEEIKEEQKQEKPKELERIIPEEEKPSFVNPLAKKEEIKKPKEKPKSEFVKNTINFIEKKGWRIIQEIEHKAKEYNCLIQINTDLGPIIFKTQAKDKKTITEADLTKILGESQAIPLPALIISPGDVQKKAIEFLEKYSSVLKFKKIE